MDFLVSAVSFLAKNLTDFMITKKNKVNISKTRCIMMKIGMIYMNKIKVTIIITKSMFTKKIENVTSNFMGIF